MATQTANLKIKLIQPTDMFADETFNAVINDIDAKVVGIAHVGSKGHWDTWKASTKYEKDDIVRITDSKSNQYYQCIVAGTSDTLEPTNVTNGSLVVDGSATWKVMTIGAGGESNGISIWLSNNYYTKGQAVLYDNTLYRCKADHKAGTDFKSDSSNWQNVKANIKYWKKSIYYQPQDIVINDNKIYSCNTAHTSTSFNSDIQNWELLSNIQEWEKSKNYIQGNIVLYDNTPYKVIKDHVSNDFSLDKDNFEITYSNIRDFNASSYYKAGSYVLYNNNIYKALKDTTGDIGHNWQKITNTQKPSIETWKTGTDYKKNEIVVYNEKIYKCAVDHTSGTDFSIDRPKYWESLSDNPIINDWISGNNYTVGTCVIKSNQNGIVDWTASKQYNVNDEVIYDGYIYICKTQNTDTEFTEANWEIKEPVYNRIYRCIKNTNSKDFNESEWQLINGDSKATVDEVDELLA